MADITTRTVPRSGQRPLRFKGERIASSDTSSHDDDRWTESTVFRLPMRGNFHHETRGYVLAVSHMTRWDGERDQHDAHVVDTLGQLAALIEELPPAVADELVEQLNIVEDLDAKEGRP